MAAVAAAAAWQARGGNGFSPLSSFSRKKIREKGREGTEAENGRHNSAPRTFFTKKNRERRVSGAGPLFIPFHFPHMWLNNISPLSAAVWVFIFSAERGDPTCGFGNGAKKKKWEK